MAQKTFEMKGNRNRAWVGGNIGNPLIDNIDEMAEDDLAVMELSSFQLELMTKAPQIAAILNITQPSRPPRQHAGLHRRESAHSLVSNPEDVAFSIVMTKPRSNCSQM